MPRREKSMVAELMSRDRRENFGRWVTDIRTAAPYHLTQKEAAERVGISRGHLSQIENGRVSVPRETVIKIAKVFDCPKEIALARAGYKVRSDALDEKAYLARILHNLKSDSLRYAIADFVRLYDLINTRKRKKNVFDLSATRSQVAEAIYLLHELPVWLREEVLGHFDSVREQEATQDQQISPARKAEAVEHVRAQIQGIEEKLEDGLNVCPASSAGNNVGIGADVYIAVSIKPPGRCPPTTAS